MSDFERRLTEALTAGAEEAPDADRLTVGARSRAKARRRTRYAVVAGVVVTALAVPVGVLALNGDEDGSPDGNPIATDPTDHSYETGNWQTVEHEGALVDLPGGWVQLDTSSCEFEFVRFGPSGSDPCTYDHDGLAFYASATFDPARGPGLELDVGGLSAGYVYAGDWAVYVQSEGPREAMRILGSARVAGQEAPDLSRGFSTEEYDGLSIEVPTSWKKGGLSAWCLDKKVDGWVEDPDTMVAAIACTPSTGYGIRFGIGSGDDDDWIRERHEPEYPEGSWAGVTIAPDANGKPVGFVQVVAPTQALAELIGGSLRVQ